MRQSWKPGAVVSTAITCGVVLALLAVAPASAAGKETRTFSSNRLEVRNLIGEVRVEGHRGSGFEVEVEFHGADAAHEAIELGGDDETLIIRFPAASDFVYPALGRSTTNLNGGDSKWLSSVGAGGRTTIKSSGRGLELWADVVIRVPRGHELRVRHGVGALTAEGVEADLDLSVQTGAVALTATSGTVQVATGSGAVKIDRVAGEQAQIATGSGDVEARDCTAGRINIATGSGDVNVVAHDGRRLQVATGSGDVKASELRADEAQVATGSGRISAALTRMGAGDFSFATGSGEIDLTLPRDASAVVHAESDNGGIEVALDTEARYAVREEDEVRLTVGDGEARVKLGTGSGKIRIGN